MILYFYIWALRLFNVSDVISFSDSGATPKGVLRVMGVQGLTIYHVKSHLQVHMQQQNILKRLLTRYFLKKEFHCSD